MSPPVDREHFIAELISWLVRRLALSDVAITPATPLFEERLIDSVRILDLIAWVERATGRQIPDTQIVMKNFRTVARIADVFLEEAAGVAD
jgi:acyl carrier protein